MITPDKLEPYKGLWVAVAGDEIIAHGRTPEEVNLWLVEYKASADSVFYVPLDPTEDNLGFETTTV